VSHHPISQANKREQQTQQQWMQQVAGNPRWERITNKTPQDRERRLEIQGEQRHSEGKRCKLNTEDVKRQVYSQNYPFFDATIGLGSKNYT
ncbi:unnamed protein product, partial [Porites evermanni]